VGALVLVYVIGFWVVVVTLIAVLLHLWRGHRAPLEVALEELRASYARAEMSRAEYEERRRGLLDSAPPR
jgi:hypothetical protein